MPTTSVLVDGLTCGHCSAAVIDECSQIDGVTGVDVDLVPGGTSTVTILSADTLDMADVEDAIDEAGDYRMVGETAA